ncbi:Rab GTPase [Histomonas meleagridis]|nr:Rab GTPase [Histomonas meleagridis]
MSKLASNIKESKLVLLGSSTVGKSSIAVRLTREMFLENSTATIGASFMSKTFEVNGIQVKLQIWDTGGAERYRAMAPMYFHDADKPDTFTMFINVCSKNTFEDVSSWLKELREKGPNDIYIGLAGNKIDLADRRIVSTNEGQEYARANGIHVFKEVSALTGENVNSLFSSIAELLSKGQPFRRPSVDITICEEKRKFYLLIIHYNHSFNLLLRNPTDLMPMENSKLYK